MGTLSVSWLLFFSVYFISSNSHILTEDNPHLHVPVAVYERGYAERAQAPKYRRNGAFRAFYPRYQTNQFRRAFGRSRQLAAYQPQRPLSPLPGSLGQEEVAIPSSVLGVQETLVPLPGSLGQEEVAIPGSVLGVQENCIGPGAAVMCEKCQISEQCSYGMMCCPHKKLCVKDSSSECEENEGAKCAPGCPDEDVHSKFNKCTCGDTRFPNAWAPTCGSLYNGGKNQYVWKEKKDQSYNKCFPRYETKYKKKCIPYDKKHCYTGNEEKCETINFQRCEVIPRRKHERKCETVIEKICHWRKNQRKKTLDSYAKKVQCHKTTGRVCDTVYRWDHQTTDEHLCEDIKIPDCKTEMITLYEKSCTTDYRFECSFDKPGKGYGNGWLKHQYQEKRYKLHPGMPADWSINKNPSYGIENEPWQKHCKKIPIEECQETPRTRHIQKCEQRSERKCQKVTNLNPRPVQEQQCKDQPKEDCEVMDQHQPIEVDIPWYDVECNDVPKEQCTNVEETKLEVKCSEEPRPICNYFPKDNDCKLIPTEYCYQAPYQVKTTDCQESYSGRIGEPIPERPKAYPEKPSPY